MASITRGWIHSGAKGDAMEFRSLVDFKQGVSVSLDRLHHRALVAGDDGRPRIWPCRLFVD